MAKHQTKTKVLFPIGVKLVVIISILLLAALGAVIALVSALSTEDVRRTAEYNNFTINRRAGSHADGSFKSVQAAVFLYLNMLDRLENVEMEMDFYNHNRNIAAIWTQNLYIPNNTYLLANNINEDDARNYLSAMHPVEPGKLLFLNASPDFNHSLLCVIFTRRVAAVSETVKVLFSPEDLSETFGTGTNTSFIVTDSGDLLLHPDSDLVLAGENLSYLPIVSIYSTGCGFKRKAGFLYR